MTTVEELFRGHDRGLPGLVQIIGVCRETGLDVQAGRGLPDALPGFRLVVATGVLLSP